MSIEDDEKRKKFLNMIKNLSEKIQSESEMQKAKDIIKIGDKVKFKRMLSEDHKVWFLPSEDQLDLIKTRIGQIAKVLYVQKHFRDQKTIEYFIDVEFDDGSYMRRINSTCFDKLFPMDREDDFDFEFI